MLTTAMLRSTLILLACTLSSGTYAFADAPRRIDVPAGDLVTALKSLAKQVDVELVFQDDQLAGLHTAGVSGTLSPESAVLKLLEGTSLRLVTDESSGAMLIAPEATSQELQRPSASISGQSARGAELEEIVVTGSRIKRVGVDGALPVNVYLKEDIERSGQATLSGFLSSLNEVSLSSVEGNIAGGNTGQTTVQLRGLPVGTTLVLVNGRRVEAVGSSVGSNFFNLSLIPLAAVERVEILPVGSSAVYGGDVLAGVVNVILKKSIEGSAIDLRYGSASGTDDAAFSLATGRTFARGSFMLLGSYSKKTPLYMGEREFFRDADYRRYGGPDARSRSCTPGTVTSSTAANIPGLNSTFAGLPSTASNQALTSPDLAPSAGSANLCASLANGNGVALSNGVESASLHATGDYGIRGSWSVFGELTYTDDALEAEERGISLNNVLVPESNPYNALGVPARVTSRLSTENGAEGFKRDSEFTRALIGLRGEVAAGWDLEAAAALTRDESVSKSVNDTVNGAALTAALASTNPATALNPFTTGRAASEDVLHGIWSDTVRNATGERSAISVFVRGPAFELPAGPIDVVAGAEWAQDEWDALGTARGATTFSFDMSRVSTAVFGEARIPVLASRADPRRGSEVAAFTLAGRRDRYSDFGEAGTYQLGLEVRPVRTMLLRAATATSFKPPTLAQIGVPTNQFASETFGLRDPRRGNEAIIGAAVLRGPNADLQPETGEALAAGVVWEPGFISGLRGAVTDWRLKIRDQIVSPSPQLFLNFESLFPGFVTRAAPVGGVPGQVTSVQFLFVNFGRTNVYGTDLELGYSKATRLGKWSISTSATRTNEYGVTLLPGSPVDDRLNKRNVDTWAPRWKGRMSVALQRPSWGIAATGRYLGSYEDAGTSTRELGGHWIVDLSADANLKNLFPAIAASVKNATVSAAVVNVADRQFEFVDGNLFFDPAQADWRGRYGSIRLSVGW